MLRGTVFLINDETGMHDRTVVSLDVDTPEQFKAECARRAAERPAGLQHVSTRLEFGVIAPPWGG